MPTAKNIYVLLFNITTSALVGRDATYVTLWDEEIGGNYLDQKSISNNPDALVLGERYEIAAETLVITQDKATNESDEMAIRALRGRIKDGFWVQVHDDDPGLNGTSNRISGIVRAKIEESDFEIEA